MKLNDLMTSSLGEVLKETDVNSLKPITDEKGEIIKIIVEYTPKDRK